MTRRNNNEAPLDIPKVHALLNDGVKFSKQAEGKNLVLIIGNGGHGKSTLGNYLVGHEMIATKIEREFEGLSTYENVITTKRKFETSDPNWFPIGHENAAETIYARTVPFQDSISRPDFLFTDCAGYFGDSSREQRCVESISTELAVRNAKQIKAVVICISLSTIQDTKSKDFKELMRTLKTIFKDPLEMLKYCVFAVTKVLTADMIIQSQGHYIPDYGHAMNSFKTAVVKFKRHCEGKKEQMGEYDRDSYDCDSSDYEEMEDYLTGILKLVKNNPESIVIADPFNKMLDNQGRTSRAAIINRINQLEPRKLGTLGRIARTARNLVSEDQNIIVPIDADDFNFSEHDPHRLDFNEAINDISCRGIVSMIGIHEQRAKLSELRNELKQNQQKIDQSNTMIQFCTQKNSKGEYGVSAEDEKSMIQTWERMIQTNEIHIQILNNDFREKSDDLKKKQEQLADIDTFDKVVLTKRSINESAWLTRRFQWFSMEFEAKAPNTKLFIERSNPIKGSWHDTDDRHNQGYYKTTFKSEYCPRNPGCSAEIVAKVYKKFHPDHKNSIPILNVEIAKLTRDINYDVRTIETLENDNRNLTSYLEKAKAGMLSKEEERIKTIQENKEVIKKCEGKIKEIQLEMETLKNKANGELDAFCKAKSKTDSELVCDLGRMIEFPSPIVHDFIKSYDEFTRMKEEYTNMFNANLNNEEQQERSDESQTGKSKSRTNSRSSLFSDLSSSGDRKITLAPTIKEVKNKTSEELITHLENIEKDIKETESQLAFLKQARSTFQRELDSRNDVKRPQHS